MKTKNNKPILYIDMDEVLVDFTGHFALKHCDKAQINPPAMYEKGFFESLQPLPGAISAVVKILNSNKFDVKILTQPVAKSPVSYTEKVNWLYKYLPDLAGDPIMTQDKSLIKGDFLIDDNEKWGKPHPVHGRVFEGILILFRIDIHPIAMWDKVLDTLGVK